MSTLINTTIGASVGGSVYSGYKTIAPNGEVDTNRLGGTTLACVISTGTSAISNSINDVWKEETQRKWIETHASATEYIESLSDEELASLDEKLRESYPELFAEEENLISNNIEEETHVKSL